MTKYVKEKPDGYRRTQMVDCKLCRSENLNLLEIGYFACSSCQFEVCIPCSEPQDGTEDNNNQRLITCDESHIMTWNCIKNLVKNEIILTKMFCKDCEKDRLNYKDGFYCCLECKETMCLSCGTKRYGKYAKQNNVNIFYIKPI